jgi:pimeloyl-ACP methyl ester carboxylesterase
MHIIEKQHLKEHLVKVTAGSVTLDGNLDIPEQAEGLVLFAHGSGSSRFSPRNQLVAQRLGEGGLATLLIDLLTPDEDEIDRWTRQYRFDIELLIDRLLGATDWLLQQPTTQHLKIGYFGSSTGAAAALMAAAKRPDQINAVVSRGGRPDLAIPVLPQVKAPTLLIVGGADVPVISLNERAFELLRTEKRFEIVPGATHLFEEPGALEQVAQLTCQWFRQYLASGNKRSA